MKTFEFFSSEKKKHENLINKLHRYILLLKRDFVESGLKEIKSDNWVYNDTVNHIRLYFESNISKGATLEILDKDRINIPIEKYSIYKNKFYFGYIDPKRLVPDETVFNNIKDFFEEKLMEPAPIPSEQKTFD